MKQITFNKAYDILEDADAIIANGSVAFASLVDPDNEDYPFLTLCWVDDEYQHFELEFTKEDNTTPSILDGFLVLKDTHGDNVIIKILKQKHLE